MPWPTILWILTRIMDITGILPSAQTVWCSRVAILRRLQRKSLGLKPSEWKWSEVQCGIVPITIAATYAHIAEPRPRSRTIARALYAFFSGTSRFRNMIGSPIAASSATTSWPIRFTRSLHRCASASASGAGTTPRKRVKSTLYK